MSSTIQLELNEINFDYVRRYVNAGHLPNFARVIERYGVAETISETRYEWLEPWIQWVTAHTGKPFEQHQVFRLGDIVERPDLEQVWERLEGQGKTVAAVSPINARNAINSSPFFLPDPWTDTKVTGSALVGDVHSAVRQAVNENAQGGLRRGNAWALAKGMLAFTRANEMVELGRLAWSAKGAGWRRAIFLDTFLAALFLRLWEKYRPDFSTLFLNTGAHIQHHYMFSSSVYDGPHRNPAWYQKAGTDPLFEVYASYDRILGRIAQRCPGARLIMATGLHQDPEPEPVYYWRAKDHSALLNKLRIPHQSVEPRMSRDFLVRCGSSAEAADAQAQMDVIRLQDKSVFTTDLRGNDIFVELSYPDALPAGSTVYGDSSSAVDLSDEAAFVALKNGRHNGVGYLIDTSTSAMADKRIPLSELAFAAE